MILMRTISSLHHCIMESITPKRGVPRVLGNLNTLGLVDVLQPDLNQLITITVSKRFGKITHGGRIPRVGD